MILLHSTGQPACGQAGEARVCAWCVHGKKRLRLEFKFKVGRGPLARRFTVVQNSWLRSGCYPQMSQMGADDSEDRATEADVWPLTGGLSLALETVFCLLVLSVFICVICGLNGLRFGKGWGESGVEAWRGCGNAKTQRRKGAKGLKSGGSRRDAGAQRLDFACLRGRFAGIMTLAEIKEEILPKLTLEEKRELAALLAEPARPEVKYMDEATFQEAKRFVFKRHAPLLRKLAE